MKIRIVRYLLLPLLSLSFVSPHALDVTGSWRMTAHRVEPAKDGITDLYTHFKDLYGGCQRDMGLVLNTGGTLQMTPAGGCQNPLGNLIMKAATKFMPGGKVSWESTDTKMVLQDGKGQRKEYDLQLSGTTMTWGYDATENQVVVRHTIEFKRE